MQRWSLNLEDVMTIFIFLFSFFFFFRHVLNLSGDQTLCIDIDTVSSSVRKHNSLKLHACLQAHILIYHHHISCWAPVMSCKVLLSSKDCVAFLSSYCKKATFEAFCLSAPQTNRIQYYLNSE